MSRSIDKKNKKGRKAGNIAFWVTFLLYSLVIHPFGPGRFIVGVVLAGIVSKIIRTMASGLDLTTHNKQDAVPESLEKVSKDTGNPEVDALLAKGREMIAQIRAENKKIPDEGLTGKLTRLETLCGDIFRAVYEKPAKAAQIRKFMDYYLPTTLKMVKAYRTLGENNVYGAEADAARKRIDDALGIVLKGCQKLLTNLYRDDMLDITTDIDVLEQMLKRDGLTESDLQFAAQQARQAAEINDQAERAAAARRTREAQKAVPVLHTTPARQTGSAQQAAPAQQAYDEEQWHAGKNTNVSQQVQDAIAQAQAHAPQAPVLHMPVSGVAQTMQNQDINF